MKPAFFGLILIITMTAAAAAGARVSTRHYLGGIRYSTSDDVKGTEAVAQNTSAWVLGLQLTAGAGLVALCYNPLKRQIVLRELKALDSAKLLSSSTLLDVQTALSQQEGKRNE